MGATKGVCLILCGGSGTRFWPSSTPEKPKQFLSLFGSESLLQGTYARAKRLVSEEQVYACSIESQEALLRAQVPTLKTILEPSGRNTAPCLMLSVAHLLRSGVAPETPMIVLPSDHHIADEAKFIDLAQTALHFAVKSGGLITLGIVPTSPHTGYGYIEAGSLAEGAFQKIARFVEKPNAAKAQEFVDSKRFYWNAGIFVWTLAAISEAFSRYLAEPWAAVQKAVGTAELKEIYSKLPSTPIDVAVMEKTDRGYVIPASMGWSDVGSWSALKDLLAKTPTDNVAVGGDLYPVESRGCLVKTSPGVKVALVGVENLIVVEDNGQILILNRDHDQRIKEVSQMVAKGKT